MAAVQHQTSSASDRSSDVAEVVANWLGLAAAPVFAAMALLAAVAPDVCSAMPGASPLTGMAVMYALMAAFHTAPWLRLASRRRRGARRD